MVQADIGTLTSSATSYKGPIDSRQGRLDNAGRLIHDQAHYTPGNPLTMSNDPNYGEFPPPPAKSGSKFWMWLGLGCGGMLLLCCGGVGGGGYYLFHKALNVSEDPTVVASATAEITEIKVPPEFSSAVRVKLSNPFSSDQSITVVVYTLPDKTGTILLMDLSGVSGPTGDQMRQSMEQSLAAQGHGPRHLIAGESQTVDVEIRGQPAKFVIRQAKDPQTNQEFIEVNGSFQGKKGPTLLTAQLPGDKYTDDQAEELVRSIK